MIRRVLAVVAVVAAVLTALALFRPALPPIAERDRGCPIEFPHRMSGDLDGRLFSRALAAFVVCTDPAGTTTLLANGTEAVWVLRAPTGVAVQRDGRNSLTRSFLRIIGSPIPALPPGSVAVVARPPSQVVLTIDPYLTLARLSHDELAASLAAQSPLLLNAAVDYALAGNRTALSRCLDQVLARLPNSEGVLRSGNPAPRLIAAAEEMAAEGGDCTDAWHSAKLGIGIPQDQATSLAADVAQWRHDEGFIIRAVSASIAYLALVGPAT